MPDVSGRRYRTLRVGVAGLAALARIAQVVAPQRDAVFPAWQGVQYVRDMFSGDAQLDPLDNDRYSGLRWTSVREHLAATSLAAA